MRDGQDAEKSKINRRNVLLLLGGLIGATGIIDSIISLGNRITPQGIVIHHSALPASEGLEDIEKLHISRGFGIFYWYRIYHIGYHYIIQANGNVVPIRPEHLQGAHARGANDMIGICVLGNFDSSAGNAVPTIEQMQSLRALSKTLLAKYQFSIADVHKHNQIDGYTVCPGDHFPFNELLASLQS